MRSMRAMQLRLLRLLRFGGRRVGLDVPPGLAPFVAFPALGVVLGVVVGPAVAGDGRTGRAPAKS